jgi:OPA family glycerol-3-phosphate transporter-like MFS transporter
MIFMSLSIIGVHGMLSGTASADFGGKKNTGLAVGLIDGLVYLGTGLQALVLGHFLPSGDAAKVVDNWWIWPWILLPVAVIGFVLSLRVWHATPQKAAAH